MSNKQDWADKLAKVIISISINERNVGRERIAGIIRQSQEVRELVAAARDALFYTGHAQGHPVHHEANPEPGRCDECLHRTLGNVLKQFEEKS